MAEKKRAKKDGQNRGNKTARASQNTADRKQGADRANVKQGAERTKRSVGTYVGERRAEAAKRGWETRRQNQKNKKKAA